jgi:hypothetical protein
MNRAKVLLGTAMIVSAAACTGRDSTAPPLVDTDVADVRITVKAPPPPGNGFSYPTDTINVEAGIVDERGTRVDGRTVQWKLQLPDGKAAGDSIAIIAPTSPTTARIIFARSALVAVVASVTRNDGTVKSGTILLQSDLLPARMASRIVAQGETEFTAAVGTAIQTGPAVLVLDDNQRPLPGVAVTFGPTPQKVVISDSAGIARFGSWQVDTVARGYWLQARTVTSAQQELLVGFYLHATPGPVAHFSVLSGNNQAGMPAGTLPDELHVRASDMYNNPIRGLPVTFSVVSGGGSIQFSTDTTDSFGVGSGGLWTLGSASPQRVTARAGDLETSFDATFCAEDHPCLPPNLSYVRNGGVWINGAKGPVLVADNARGPAWSPDGSRIAFFKVNVNGQNEAICIAAEPFSDSTCTAFDAFNDEMRVSWSPDGRTLALSRIYYGPGSLQLLFVDVATMAIRAHGTIDGSVWSASWSPDGKNMAIGSDSKVYLADAAGAGLEVLLGAPVWDIAWAPSGQKIALISVECDFFCWGGDVELLDPKTKEVSVLQRNSGGTFDGLTWSPDGIRLAYSAWDAASGMSNVRIVNLTTGESGVVLTNASDPSWRR